MSGDAQLRTSLEVSGLIRAAEATGGHAMVLRKGDPDRGILVLFVVSKGQVSGCFERSHDFNGDELWRETGRGEFNDSAKVSAFLAKQARFDPDFWAIELDIPDPERFIAETLRVG